jgi:hypothetical protein
MTRGQRDTSLQTYSWVSRPEIHSINRWHWVHWGLCSDLHRMYSSSHLGDLYRVSSLQLHLFVSLAWKPMGYVMSRTKWFYIIFSASQGIFYSNQMMCWSSKIWRLGRVDTEKSTGLEKDAGRQMGSRVLSIAKLTSHQTTCTTSHGRGKTGLWARLTRNHAKREHLSPLHLFSITSKYLSYEILYWNAKLSTGWWQNIINN